MLAAELWELKQLQAEQQQQRPASPLMDELLADLRQQAQQQVADIGRQQVQLPLHSRCTAACQCQKDQHILALLCFLFLQAQLAALYGQHALACIGNFPSHAKPHPADAHNIRLAWGSTFIVCA